MIAEQAPLFSLIPDGVRRCEEVPNAECLTCGLDATDHTVKLNFPISYGAHVAYEKVCLKDLARHRGRQR